MTSPLLRLHNVSLSFEGVKAISDIGFEVAAGEIGALIGPNGAGKRSLLNVINGVYRADTGNIVFDGARRDPQAKPRVPVVSLKANAA